MKNTQIQVQENLNLITVRNVSAQLNTIIKLLDYKDAYIITCNVKPTNMTDILISASDKCFFYIAKALKNIISPCNSIAVRSGICRLCITNYNCSIMKNLNAITSFFQRKNVYIERIVTSKHEIQIFFPALEVCGCLDAFVSEFENHLHIQ